MPNEVVPNQEQPSPEPEQEKPGSETQGPNGAPQNGDVGATSGNESENIIERATEKAVKRELRWPESIMAFFTIAIACASMAQCHEMQTSGIDTSNLADAASLQAKGLAALARITQGNQQPLSDAAHAAQSEATGLGGLTKTTGKEMVVANRAWISPGDASNTKRAEPDTYDITVHYQNPGKSPAVGVVHAFALGQIDITKTRDLDHVYAGANNTCGKLIPPPEGQVLYPGVNASTGFNIAGRKDVVDKSVTYVQGCFVYITMGTVHKSSFCIFTDPKGDKPFEQKTYLICADGNHAD
jgi:hypothetical protein